MWFILINLVSRKRTQNKAILVTIKKEYMDFTYEMWQALSFNGYH